MTDVTCPKCERIHTRCAAHNRDGAPCGREPRPYMRVCFIHGGASPAAIQSAAKRQADGLVTATYDGDRDAVLAAQGLEPVGDPLTELGKLAASSIAWMDALGARINALESIRFTDAKGAEQLASEISLFERAQDRTAKLLKILVDSGFEERRLRLDEATASAFTQVLNAVLARLDLSPAQRGMVPGIVVEELKALEQQ